MHPKVASIVLLVLGLLDIGALNLLLAPRLASVSAVPEPLALRTAAAQPGRAPEPQAVVALAEVQAAAPAPSDAATQPTRAARDVPFWSDSVVVRGAAVFRDLARVRQELAADPSRALLLRGHSDPAGKAAYNLDLARRRAEAVKEHLVRRGAPEDRIAVEAVGAAELVDSRPTRTAWARDRRVEVLWR